MATGTTDGPIEIMLAIREMGYCVVLKIMPPAQGFILDEPVSEYDAPRDTTRSRPGMWACEAQYMGDGPWRHDEWALSDAPEQALLKVCCGCQAATASILSTQHRPPQVASTQHSRTERTPPC